ncbi:MAG: 2,3-epoxybenzoyl-CoA dihydrolase [Deltaproteobacteria bacterium]|nr:2,3-epoxybenzoyl-CoA dihydrolase [Deltaproteobacteria bacterium]
MADTVTPHGQEPIRFETHPSRYKHWKLAVDGAVARLSMDIDEDGGLRPGYPLKLNSYDLGVDIELADAIQRLRFEHPAVKTLVVQSGKDRVFCSGANIYMLGMSTHPFKVNFCKYTNETRLGLEELSAEGGVKTLCAVNGPCAGGGYELALACDEIYLSDDGSSAVSLPEVPLLAVLPGTGGLTRLVDKRKVRRDLADVFCTLAEGIRGPRAAQWNLVDKVVPRSKFVATVDAHVQTLVAQSTRVSDWEGLVLEPLGATYRSDGADYRHVTLQIDQAAHVARITVRAPTTDTPTGATALREQGNALWALRAFRELDDALLNLRFNHETIGLLLLETEGDPAKVLSSDAAMFASRDDGFVHEVLLFQRRVLKRLDQSARSIFAFVREGSCFVGSLFELSLAADRTYHRDDPDAESPATVQLSALNGGAFLMSNGLSRLQTRFLHDPERPAKLLAECSIYDARAAEKVGLVTLAPDAIDWDDEVRLAIEERASISPDALTGMEASLRYAGPETLETKIFGRLSAWQNWIFTRPNSTGPRGALTMYGQPERPEFDWRRT